MTFYSIERSEGTVFGEGRVCPRVEATRARGREALALWVAHVSDAVVDIVETAAPADLT